MGSMTRALPPGTLIHNRYQIRKVLGEGGFGVTYQALDLKEKLPVALKEYMPIDMASRRSGSVLVYANAGYEAQFERFRTRFLEEAKLIYRYRDHPNIISVKHLFYENNTAYYAMEFMEGQDLSALLKKPDARFAWETAKPVFEQVVGALRTVHESGMVHCDISPDNLFIQNSGRVKLIDFGAAKNVVKGQTSVIILKKGYAPPEQFATNGKIGPWTDIYALAVTIYRTTTGKMPPPATERLAGDRTVWPSQMGLMVPGAFWESALQKAMALRIEDRYQNIESFWEDLNKSEITTKRLVLEGTQGLFEGSRIIPAQELLFGTDPGRCRIVYPKNIAGISHVHMRIWETEGQLMAMDMGSRYGTFLNYKAMTPGLVYELGEGDILELGSRQIFRVVSETR